MCLKYLFRRYSYDSTVQGHRMITNQLSADKVRKAEGGRSGQQTQGDVMGSSAPAVSPISFRMIFFHDSHVPFEV
jgi:hypothetical protein